MPQTFSTKHIRLTITMAGGGTSRVVQGLAVDVSVEKVGLPDLNKARVQVTNMRYEDMASLTVLAFKPLQIERNLMVIDAGTEAGMATVFRGEIVSASADFNAAPDVVMNFDCVTGAYPSLMAKPPVAVSGGAQAADLISQFASEAGYTFRNEGVTAGVKNAVFNGNPLEKARAVASQIGADLLVDDNEIILLPANTSRSGSVTFLSKEAGMIGYPTFTQDGISLQCLFNPDLKQNGMIQVESVVPRATGQWRIVRLSHNLSAYHPHGGPWETSIEANLLI